MYGVNKFMIQLPKYRSGTCSFSELCGGFISIKNGVLQSKMNFVRFTHSYTTSITNDSKVSAKSRFSSRSCTSNNTMSSIKADLIRQLSGNRGIASWRIDKGDLKHGGMYDFDLIYKTNHSKFLFPTLLIVSICFFTVTIILTITCSDVGAEILKIDRPEDKENVLTILPIVFGVWTMILWTFLYFAHTRTIMSIYRNKSSIERSYIAVRPHMVFWEKILHFKHEEINVLKNNHSFSVQNQKLFVNGKNFLLPVYCDQLFGVDTEIPIFNKQKDRNNIQNFSQKIRNKYPSSEKSEHTNN